MPSACTVSASSKNHVAEVALSQGPICASLAGEHAAVTHHGWVARNCSENGAGEGASHVQLPYNSFSLAFLCRLRIKADW